MVRRLVTIGVYGSTSDRFLAALKHVKVDVLLDVRQRRGVRGAEYAWANSQRLQQALADRGIAYRHLKELAPTSEIRAVQYAADAATGEGKRTRAELSAGFKRAYVERILEPADLGELLASFDDSCTAALLCVERDPQACHRSLIADRLAADHGGARRALDAVNRILVVSKSRMRGGHVCVGGDDLDDRMLSLRLLRPDGTNMPADARFEIGQVWKLHYEPAPRVTRRMWRMFTWIATRRGT